MENLMTFLTKRKDDAGMMALLRHGLSASRQEKAWPVLARFCDLGDETPQGRHRCDVVRTVAGLYAMHPEQRGGGNLGSLCRELCADEERKALTAWENVEKEKRHGPVARRLLYLLGADRSEICARVVRIVLYAKSKGIGVNYERLAWDLLGWPDARGRWAQMFWGAPAESHAGEDGTPEDQAHEENSL